MMDSVLITQTLVCQLLAAFFGTLAFSVLFSVPRKYYLHCAFCGMLGWFIYIILSRHGACNPAEATFFGTLAVAMMSRLMSYRFRCPSTIFLIAGIFPMVPGGGIYWTIYYVVSGQYHNALSSGGTAVMVTVAIVFAIIIVNELPSRFFRFGR